MKKLFLVLMLICCSSLYAKTKTFVTNGGYYMGDYKTRSGSSYAMWVITAILPYENGYVMKISKLHDDRKIEYFITKGFYFYVGEEGKAYKCVIADIQPNLFTAELEEVSE